MEKLDQKAISDTIDKLKIAQAQWKRTLDKWIRKQHEESRKEVHVFLPIERKNDKDLRHKLDAIGKVPFEVKNVDNEANKVVI